MDMKFHFSFGYHHSTYQAWNLFMDTHNMTFQYSFISFDFTTVRTYHRSVKNNNFQDKMKKNYKECLDLGHCKNLPMIMNKLHVIGQIGDNGSTLVTNSFFIHRRLRCFWCFTFTRFSFWFVHEFQMVVSLFVGIKSNFTKATFVFPYAIMLFIYVPLIIL